MPPAAGEAAAQGNGDAARAVTLFRQAHVILARTGAADARVVASELNSFQAASAPGHEPALQRA